MVEIWRSLTMRVMIDELVKNAGITKVRLSRKIDVTPRTLRRWNSGKAMPNISNIEMLKKVLSCKTIDLFDFE